MSYITAPREEFIKFFTQLRDGVDTESSDTIGGGSGEHKRGAVLSQLSAALIPGKSVANRSTPTLTGDDYLTASSSTLIQKSRVHSATPLSGTTSLDTECLDVEEKKRRLQQTIEACQREIENCQKEIDVIDGNTEDNGNTELGMQR